MNHQPEDKLKIGLTLSGGGARGFAHLGALQAFDELGLHIDAISGASAGAVCGAFYFAGHKPKDILAIIKSYKVYHWARPLWRKQGLLNMDKIAELFSRYLPTSFEELDRPLTVSVTDLVNAESLLISSGLLVPIVCASACIPVLFQPIKYLDTQLVDGGILNNFPVEPLFGKAEKIIGVHINPVVPGMHTKNYTVMADRNINLMLRREILDKKGHCTVFIEPQNCGNHTMMDLGAADKLFEIGYTATMQQKEELLLLQ